MSREEIYKEVEEMFGLVPTMFKSIPDSSLELEWNLFKQVQFAEGPIPNKYRELIGLGVSAATKCRFCALFHTEVAKLYGATDAELEAAVHYTKSSVGWSTYLHGMEIDYDTFKREIEQAVSYVKSKQGIKSEADLASRI
jgi:AhpD family alkylhydroperoxidase